jgi:hypothetical protein
MTAIDSVRRRSGPLGRLLLVLVLGGGVWWLMGGRNPVNDPETAIWGAFETLPLAPEETADTADVDDRSADTPLSGPVSSDFELMLRFSADSWAEASNGEGERLLYELVPVGQTRTVRGPLPLTLALGNAAAVELRVDDRVIATGTELPGRGGVARFRLLADPDAPSGVSVVPSDNPLDRTPEAAPPQESTANGETGPADANPAITAVAGETLAAADPMAVRLHIQRIGPGEPGELLRIAGDGLFADRVRTLLLDDPPRAVVDLLDAELADGSRAASDHPDVIRVRIGRHSDRIRVVLDLRESRTITTRVEGDQLIVR